MHRLFSEDPRLSRLAVVGLADRYRKTQVYDAAEDYAPDDRYAGYEAITTSLSAAEYYAPDVPHCLGMTIEIRMLPSLPC